MLVETQKECEEESLGEMVAYLNQMLIENQYVNLHDHLFPFKCLKAKQVD
jgi:hypothetical protein